MPGQDPGIVRDILLKLVKNRVVYDGRLSFPLPSQIGPAEALQKDVIAGEGIRLVGLVGGQVVDLAQSVSGRVQDLYRQVS